jgi:hypothetical protein
VPWSGPPLLVKKFNPQFTYLAMPTWADFTNHGTGGPSDGLLSRLPFTQRIPLCNKLWVFNMLTQRQIVIECTRHKVRGHKTPTFHGEMLTPGVTMVSTQPCNSHGHPQPTGKLIVRTKAPQIHLNYTNTCQSLEKHIKFVFYLDRKASIPYTTSLSTSRLSTYPQS